MLNTVTARADGRELLPLSASVRADMSGYCWTAQITLPPDDFAALGLDGRAAGAELPVSLSVNGHDFVFLAEEYGDNRRFGQRSYTVSGRSLSAKLGADYAQSRAGTVEQDLYARQIADAQLADLGFTIRDWHITDWLVAGGAYSLTGKSPAAVLAELAQAAGGFVASHPSEPELSLLPRWKTAAWQVGQAVPDVSVPINLILEIGGRKQTKTQYDGVFVWGTAAGAKAADVTRAGSGGLSRAPAVSGGLYTDYAVCEAVGIAALSESGIHKQETVRLPVADKYGLRLARLGEIWAFAESAGTWKGVVTGVRLDVQLKNDAPYVVQILEIDRYLGN